MTLDNDAANDNQAGFTGHIKDTDTGLNYMQARYYDPVIGRFLSHDPVGFSENIPAFFNRYAYSFNDPINLADSTGMAPDNVMDSRSQSIADSVRNHPKDTAIVGGIVAGAVLSTAIPGPEDLAIAAVGATKIGQAIKGAISAKKLNLGSGDNPMPGAINVDNKLGEGVDVVADANALPFGTSSMDEVHAVNPNGFNPVNTESARVLKPGGTLSVTGTAKNPDIVPPSSSALSAMGLRQISQGPMSKQHSFGTQRMTDGRKLNANTSSTTVYRKD